MMLETIVIYTAFFSVLQQALGWSTKIAIDFHRWEKIAIFLLPFGEYVSDKYG